MLNARILSLAVLAAIALSACENKPSDPGPTPPAETMSFKQASRYEVESYQTDPSSGQSISSTRRKRTWTLVNTSASLYSRTNVAVYVDSVIEGGSVINVTDTILLHQESGTNNVYRYASLAPELDFTGTANVRVDLGRQWMREAWLNATTAGWFVGEATDTVQVQLNVAGFQGLKITVNDTAVGSTTEDITIDGTTYKATKTTHKLEMGISAIVNIPVLGNTSVRLKTESLSRTSWTVPSLGCIAREERQGKVINVSSVTFSGVTIPELVLPVPGYIAVMTRVIARGN